MAITQVGSTVSGTANNGGDVTLTLPTMAEGDVVVLIGGYAQKPSTDPATPTGYTLITVGSTVTNAANGYGRIGAWYKVQGPTPDASVTGAGFGSTSASTTYHAIVLRGVDTAAVVDVTSAVVANSAEGAPDAPAVTVATVGAWVFAVGYANTTDDVVTGISGYTGLTWAAADDTHDCSLGFSYKEATATGSEDPAAYTDISGFNPGAFTFAIKPAAGGVGGAVLVVDHARSATRATSPTLAQSSTITVGSARASTRTTSPTLAQSSDLTVTSARAIGRASSPALTQTTAITVEGARAATRATSPTPTVTDPGSLNIRSARSATRATSPTLTQSTALTILAARAPTRASSPTLATTTGLLVDGTRSSTRATSPTLTQSTALLVNSARSASRTTRVVMPGTILPAAPPERTITVPAETRILVVAAESRTTTIPAEPRTTTA